MLLLSLSHPPAQIGALTGATIELMLAVPAQFLVTYLSQLAAE